MPCYLYSRNLKLLNTFDTFQFHFAFLNFRCNSEFYYLLKLQFWIASDIIMQLYDVCAVRLTLDLARYDRKMRRAPTNSQQSALRVRRALKAEQCLQDLAMLSRLSNTFKTEQCSQDSTMLSKLSNALKAEQGSQS